MKKILFSLLVMCSMLCSAQNTIPQPKRDFRGAWIQCVNGQFQGMSTSAMQAELTRHLDALQACNCNVVIFQVRPEADALYNSPYEPWSRFLTGKQGTPPSPYWDPLAWMVKECHKRGMELHAWINPFRAKTKGTKEISVIHPYLKNRNNFFRYDGLILFDPGLPENRTYICKVAGDIVRRYNVDGLHIDDYFYPYPVAGEEIPDHYTYESFKRGINNIADWRRNNVNLFIKELHDTLRAIKPWVKFGVSPFGIYHNEKAGSNVPGSKTGGLQNYDDLYADVLKWVDEGWVDYVVPQLYWQIGHKTADYKTLVEWWARYCAQRPLIIGQDIERTMNFQDVDDPTRNQMRAKYTLQRETSNISGNCLWYSKNIADNYKNYATGLARNYQRYPALQPEMKFMDDKNPGKVRRLKTVSKDDGLFLCWDAPTARDIMQEATKYVVYRFNNKREMNLDDPSKIVAITTEKTLKLPYSNGMTPYYYVVTALDRVQNESLPKGKIVKL